MNDASNPMPATAAPASKPENPAPAPNAAHIVSDPGDASPIGRADESDFVPQGQTTHPLTVVLSK